MKKNIQNKKGTKKHSFSVIQPNIIKGQCFWTKSTSSCKKHTFLLIFINNVLFFNEIIFFTLFHGKPHDFVLEVTSVSKFILYRKLV
jgi:hypothetical protein